LQLREIKSCENCKFISGNSDFITCNWTD